MTLTATSAATNVLRNCFPLRDSLAERESPRNASCGWVRQLIHAGAAPASSVAITASNTANAAPIQSTCRLPRKFSAVGKKRCRIGTIIVASKNSQRAADRSQHACLSHGGSQQVAPTGSQRGSHCHLLPPTHGAGEKKIHDIDAADEQQACDCDQENDEAACCCCPPDIAGTE